MNLTRTEAVEILKALSRIEGTVRSDHSRESTEFACKQLDYCVELLTEKLKEEK